MKLITLLTLVSMLVFSGCDIFKTKHTKRAEATNFEDKITYTKQVSLNDKNLSTPISIKEGLSYLQLLNGADSKYFLLNGTKIKLNLEAIKSSEENGTDRYSVKLYGINSDKSDFIMLLQVSIHQNNSSDTDDNSSGIDDNSTDNNSSSGSIDDNNSGSDNNNSGGIDDNNSTDNNSSNDDGIDDNSTDNNNSSGDINDNNSTDSNNGTGEDNNNSDSNDNNGSENNNTPLISDSDNDNIPDNIETLLGMDSNNSDENNDGVIDGLEGDPFFNKEWYIHADGTPMNPSEVPSIVGNDLNLLTVYKRYMGYNSGKPIILQIVDSGVDIHHEDLQANIDLNRSLDGADQGNPVPGGFYLPHGTMLAGIAAARAFNGVGVRGVAPFAKIAGSNWLVQQSLDGLDAAWLSGNGANEIAVTNNSWGTYYTIDTFYEDIMEEGVKTLRNGKGRIYVFASGNARADNADANIQYVINNRFALVVSALDYQNRVPEYSTPGANVWIAAYGGASGVDKGPTIATTYPSGSATQTWDEDSNKSYTYAMAGTSAAAPMVTGAVALILEACPNLGWRDVKYILAKTAQKVDNENEEWLTNSAGFHFNRNYGFGLINTEAAIEMCHHRYQNLPKQKSVEATFNAYLNLSTETNIDLTIPDDIKAEWVETTIDIDSQNASDLDIYLTSPSGTRVQLIKSGTKVDEYHIPDPNWMNGGFRFSTGAFLDETTAGKWRVTVTNRQKRSAQFKSVQLKIYGYKE